MVISKTKEFFLYNPDLTDDQVDFTDDRTFSSTDRLNFLKKYADFLQNDSSYFRVDEKVVSKSEIEQSKLFIEETKLPLNTNEIVFDKMDVKLVKRLSRYKNWNFYTEKVSVLNNALLFGGDGLHPTPAATYFFDSKERVKNFSFSFNMDSAFKGEIIGGVLDTTYGRTVELRSDNDDVIKLQFYSNGSIYARCGNICSYHLKNYYIGQFSFDEEHKIDIAINETDFTVTLDGMKSNEMPLSCKLNPNMLYVGSGMIQVGNWEFRPYKLSFENSEIVNYFLQNENDVGDAISLGEQNLPFAIGTEENKNREIVLTKHFSVDNFSNAILNVETLDPGGKIYINDNLVLSTDSFDEINIDISSYLKPHDNLLKIIVNPRAPENLFNWHRQKDPYNGWFCGNVRIFLNQCVSNVEVITKSINDDVITAKLTACFSEASRAEIGITKISPEKGDYQIIESVNAKSGNNEFLLSFGADLWSPESPNVYAFSIKLYDENETLKYTCFTETGFRIIEQKNGDILLNGKKIMLNGALLMQFLPPHSETPLTHICPKTEQIIEQLLMAKKMNCNTVRLHVLGYGTNDERIATIANRLGIMICWITRYIDSVEQMALEEEWIAKDRYLMQIKSRINHPSIIMWEGANEFHPKLSDINRIYKAFVSAVKEVDTSRIICPISHLYYAGDLYHLEGCSYFNDDGTEDYLGNPAETAEEWNDPLVIRSAHTYSILLGYGTGWDSLRKGWSHEKELYKSRKHAYIVSEFAVIGRQNPNTAEAKEYFNGYSYEFTDEKILDMDFSEQDWRESQSYQALCAKADTQMMRKNGVDGMMWCSLMGGANDAGYLKPPIDCYGYPKAAFNVLKEAYQNVYTFSGLPNCVKNKNWVIKPTVCGLDLNENYLLNVVIRDENGKIIKEKDISFIAHSDMVELEEIYPDLIEKGYYSIDFSVSNLD